MTTKYIFPILNHNITLLLFSPCGLAASKFSQEPEEPNVCKYFLKYKHIDISASFSRTVIQSQVWKGNVRASSDLLTSVKTLLCVDKCHQKLKAFVRAGANLLV